MELTTSLHSSKFRIRESSYFLKRLRTDTSLRVAFYVALLRFPLGIHFGYGAIPGIVGNLRKLVVVPRRGGAHRAVKEN